MSYSLVDFYRENKISPVRQDISDIKAHFERRGSLYRLLGVAPSLLEGKSILEVGPGGGFNAVFTASLAPALYHLVEGNPTGIDHIKEQLAKLPEFTKNIEIFCSLLEDYKQEKTYDLVICEGMLSGVPYPRETLALLKKYVKPGGVLIITCIDNISYFPDTLRRLVAQLLIDKKSTLEEQTAKLLPVFSLHFEKLPGMNRPAEDWIIDNLINPASIGALLSIPDAIEVLSGEFDFYGSSPDFVTDWRWYKQLISKDKRFNERALNQYWCEVHNFIDYSQKLPERSLKENQLLYKLCVDFRLALRALEDSTILGISEGKNLDNTKLLQEIRLKLSNLSSGVKKFNSLAYLAINEIISWLETNKDSTAYLDACPNFQKLFGRGQQYLSFIKNYE